MIKFLAVAFLSLSAFGQSVQAGVGSVRVCIEMPGIRISLRIEWDNPVENLPEEFVLCGRVIREGEQWCVYKLDCDDNTGYARPCDSDGPFRFFTEEIRGFESGPPVATRSEELMEAPCSISYNPLLGDSIRIAMTLPYPIRSDRLPSATRKDDFPLTVLGSGSGSGESFADEVGPSMIPAGSVVVLRGSARRVLTTLVNDLHLGEATFTLDSGEHVYQLLPDLANDDWHVLQDGLIVRSVNIPPVGG